MNKIFLALVLSFALIAPMVKAAPLSAYPVRIVFKDGLVSQNYWYTLYSPLAKSIKGVMIANSGKAPLGIAVGGVDSEVQQLIIPAGQSAGTFYPFVVSQAQRISIKALDSVGATGSAFGEANFSFMFN